MEFKIKIGDNDEIRVDHLEFGVSTQGATEGWADVYIRVRDMEADIYTDETKKIWIEWLNDNCGEKNNPEKRVLPVEVENIQRQRGGLPLGCHRSRLSCRIQGGFHGRIPFIQRRDQAGADSQGRHQDKGIG